MPNHTIDKYILPIAATTLIVVAAFRFARMPVFATRDALWTVASIPLAAVALGVCDFLRYRTRASLWIFTIALLAIAIVSKPFSMGLGVVLRGIWIFTTFK